MRRRAGLSWKTTTGSAWAPIFKRSPPPDVLHKRTAALSHNTFKWLITWKWIYWHKWPLFRKDAWLSSCIINSARKHIYIESRRDTLFLTYSALSLNRSYPHVARTGNEHKSICCWVQTISAIGEMVYLWPTEQPALSSHWFCNTEIFIGNSFRGSGCMTYFITILHVKHQTFLVAFGSLFRHNVHYFW